jgi:periplasmic divalent cation tolerance protein
MVNEIVVVLTTMPDAGADELARVLVDERLAACVNVQEQMTSFYRWKGALERETERQLVIKTTRARLTELEKRLRELHPYEVPEFIVLPGDASEAYGSWVKDCTSL